jgi:outer membrane receptor for ferrienterochelin and colicin
MTAGISYQYDNLNENLDMLYTNRYESIPGAFAEFSFAGIDKFVATAGLRIDNHNRYGTFYTPRFHIKYDLFENTVIRASAGKGYRSSYIYAENSAILASSRAIIIEEDLKQEEAWNYGLNAMSEFDFLGIFFTLNIDYFHTRFINQVVMDMDRDVRAIYFSNLNGESFSNSFQIDLIIEPFSGFTASTAFRINDVKSTYDGVLRDKPLQSLTKSFLNLAYTLPDESWSFDFTFDYNGKGRLPSTNNNPEEFRLGEEFPGYLMLHAQITKRFGKLEVYLGGENLGDYIQPNPIIAYKDPFGPFFDTSMVWGPIMGRKMYMGARYSL